MADEKFSNFLTDIIDADLADGKVDVVHTRFPPEPNGYLHIGSAKAIFINYTIAKHYGGLFNLRFDDTNPAREGDEYVQSILQDLKWLGAEPNGGIFYGSDYFERCYEYAEQLIKEGKAYVDDLTREEMQEYRGLVLVMVQADAKQRQEAIAVANIFRANIVDVAPETLMIELTGNQAKVDAFIRLLDGFKIVKLVRTGVTGLIRGLDSVADYLE